MSDTTFYKNYTLEKHLKFLSEIDKDYELLYSIWELNKKNLTQGLNLVSNTYPHYSKHDISHSMTIVNNIQCLLGEERIKRLGATDTFLILMACLTHDIGMILTYKVIEEEWKKNSFKELLLKLASSSDPIIEESARLLLNCTNTDELNRDSFKWALEIKNAVIILTAEIFRSKHAKQSADNILSNDEFKKLADNYYSEQLPNRFVELLADIALLHGENFSEVMNRLYQEANGYKGDYIHPRFIACLIRLGDLLDFDNNRFNEFSIASIKQMPETSIMHQQKHAAVRHMLVSPLRIEAELDCPNESVYRTARNWFDWLEEEVNNQSREWPNISPSDLGGLPPIISKDSIKILYKGIQASPELLNLKFTMSQKKMFHILQGGGIYKEPGFAFIREIVQNAFDASKIQMWNDIKAGIYDAYFRDNNKSVDSIVFPDDIMPSIYRQYPINLTITWLNEAKDTIHIECEDFGTGISESSLLRMTKYVGESHHKDQWYVDNYDNMPYWLRPTAAFGIGLQSIFFVANSFEVATSYPNEKSKRIIFRSAADSQYCSIVEENINRKRGTTIKVDINKEKFAELFGTSFSWDILDSVDVFRDEGDDIYLAKIDNFVVNTFKYIKTLCFNYKTINPERNLGKDVLVEPINYSPTNDENYKLSYRYSDGFLVFDFIEKQFGSSFSLWFNNDMKHSHCLYQRLLLRDVVVSNAKFSYWRTGYLGFEWNLNNQTTDTVVDLSRDNLTYTGKEWITHTLLSKLLPKTLELISERFIHETQGANSKTNDLDIQYLNYCLTAYAYQIPVYDKDILSRITIPREICSLENEGITADKLFGATTLILINGFKANGTGNIIQTEIGRIEEQYKKELSGSIVIWGDEYLHNSLMFNYICSGIIIYDSDCKIYKLEKVLSNNGQYKPIKSVDGYLNILDNMGLHKCSRKAIYGLEKYSNISVRKCWISGFENFPHYSSCCIYSPFTSKREIEDLLNNVKGMSESDTKNYLRQNISIYITPYMMGIIKEYNINTNISDDKIKEDYVNLIYDFIQLKQSSNA